MQWVAELAKHCMGFIYKSSRLLHLLYFPMDEVPLTCCQFILCIEQFVNIIHRQ